LATRFGEIHVCPNVIFKKSNERLQDWRAFISQI
jgi:hypothetical protein